MMKLVFATHNEHKLHEVAAILGNEYELLSLKDIGCNEEIPETGNTLEENALQKAQYVKDHFGYDCFADDTGLEVSALGGQPGIYSARYAGPGHKQGDNRRLLLANMKGIEDRKAQFRTVIALIINGETLFFEGTIKGSITINEYGTGGFGYDPIFVPEGYTKTFSEMGDEIKNTISHRARAVSKLVSFLKSQ